MRLFAVRRERWTLLAVVVLLAWLAVVAPVLVFGGALDRWICHGPCRPTHAVVTP